LGEPDKGRELNNAFRALVAEYEAKSPGGKSALFVWAYYDTLYGYQTNQLPAELLPNLKVTNALGRAEVADPSQAFVPIEAEDLLKLDPDVLFIYVSHGEQGKANPVYAQLRSVKEGHAYFVGAHYSQPTGPLARELVFREMAHLIYPDTFSAPEQGENVASVIITP
jgi:iron complex transport system substrate-binding protein